MTAQILIKFTIYTHKIKLGKTHVRFFLEIASKMICLLTVATVSLDILFTSTRLSPTSERNNLWPCFSTIRDELTAWYNDVKSNMLTSFEPESFLVKMSWLLSNFLLIAAWAASRAYSHKASKLMLSRASKRLVSPKFFLFLK